MILIILIISESVNIIQPGKHIGRELKWITIFVFLRTRKSTRLYQRRRRYGTVTIFWVFYLKSNFIFLLKILHNNWWSRNYVLQLHSCSFYDNLSYFFLDENFLVMMCLDNTIMILDRSTMTLKHVSIPVEKTAQLQKMK